MQISPIQSELLASSSPVKKVLCLSLSSAPAYHDESSESGHAHMFTFTHYFLCHESITECFKLEETSNQAGSSTGCPGPYPDYFWVFLRMETAPSLVFGHPHNEKVYPEVQREPPIFQFAPTASGPATGHDWKELCSFFVTSLHVLIGIDEIPLSLLSSDWTAPAPSALPHSRGAPVPQSS